MAFTGCRKGRPAIRTEELVCARIFWQLGHDCVIRLAYAGMGLGSNQENESDGLGRDYTVRRADCTSCLCYRFR